MSPVEELTEPLFLEEKKPVRRRTRKTTGTASGATESGAEVSPSEGSVVAGEEVPRDEPKPRGRRATKAEPKPRGRKSTSAKAAADTGATLAAESGVSPTEVSPTGASSTEAIGAASTAPTIAATPEEPPKRRRGRPRKVVVEEGTEGASAASASSGQTVTPTSAVKTTAAKATRTRSNTRSKAKAAETALEAPMSGAVIAGSESGAVEVKPAPARRRRTIKAAAAEDVSNETKPLAENQSVIPSSVQSETYATPENPGGEISEYPEEGRAPRRQGRTTAVRNTRQNVGQGRTSVGSYVGGYTNSGYSGGYNNNFSNNGYSNNRSNYQRQNNNNTNNDHRRQRRPHNVRQQNREFVPSVSREELAALRIAELRAKAAELEVDYVGLKKAALVEAVFEASARAEGFVEVEGILDILTDGYGFLRTQGYLPSETDAYVSLSTIRRNGLRKGDMVRGQTRPARENEKYGAIQKVLAVNGIPADEQPLRQRFADLTPVYPDERLLMEHGKNTITARVIDLVAPIGKGQRGLIVSPPKAGKTTILKDIAAAISANNPEVHLMCLLVDERPEEVTDMERSIRGEVISSTFDMPSENHIAVAELVIERAKRLVESGADVVILLDSITRLARAYNLAQPASGRILSGGVDSTALYPPKRFLGAARNIEGGGSLTILASALIDTGSKMDEVIFEEFKGTGNMELKLDRSLADRRIFPAIDPVTSGTRKEELLIDPQEAPLIWAVRRILANLNNTERAMDMLIKSLKQTDTNQEFLIRTAKKAQASGKLDENFEL